MQGKADLVRPSVVQVMVPGTGKKIQAAQGNKFQAVLCTVVHSGQVSNAMMARRVGLAGQDASWRSFTGVVQNALGTNSSRQCHT